jgi:hypothetical protein
MRLTLLLPVLALLLAGACASKPSQPETAVGGSEEVAWLTTDPPAAYRQAMTIGTVSGGKDVMILQPPYVSNAQLQAGLRDTLAEARLLATGGGRFRLDATMTHLDQPLFAGDMKISAGITYRLTDTTTGAVIYEKAITGIGEAGLFTSYGNAYYRLQQAQRLAVRASMRLSCRTSTAWPAGRLPEESEMVRLLSLALAALLASTSLALADGCDEAPPPPPQTAEKPTT